MWESLVGRLSQPTKVVHLEGTLAAPSRDFSVPHSHLLTLPRQISSRRRRTMGVSSWRMWPGCECPHWSLAVHRASLCPRDASTLAGPRSGDLRAGRHPCDAAVSANL